jgi:hypothetical protein
VARTIDGDLNVTDWKESTLAELGPGAKITEARVTQQFSGGLKGEGSVTWVMCYTSAKSARFVGMQRFTGVLGSSKGGFVMETEGFFDGTTAKWHSTIVPGSGTGELAGIEGEGQFEAPHGPKASYRIAYSMERVASG